MNKKMIMQILSIIVVLTIGFLLGWKATILNGNVFFDKANANVGYFECWGRVDEYYINSKTPTEIFDYYEYAESLNLVEIINANDLTFEKLQNRNGNLIIERVVGIVEDAHNGTGRVLFGDPEYNYINYSSVSDIRNGNIICTYFIYNPDTNYEDDILMRFDYVIDSMAIE